MPDATFLETYSLYRRFAYGVPQSIGELPRPAIHMDCPQCFQFSTFKMPFPWSDEQLVQSVANQDFAMPSPDYVSPRGLVLKADYQCSACDAYSRAFLIYFDGHGNTIQKVGQHPPVDVSIDPSVAKAMSSCADEYRKGRISESHGFGIGSFAYYRRIVEHTIDQLLDSLPSMMTAEENAQYTAALVRAKAETQAARKIELVVDMLPPILRPDGMNPLSVLYESLSKGIHSLDDEQCLEWAEQIRIALEFLITHTATIKLASSRFTNAMRKQLERTAAHEAKKKTK